MKTTRGKPGSWRKALAGTMAVAFALAICGCDSDEKDLGKDNPAGPMQVTDAGWFQQVAKDASSFCASGTATVRFPDDGTYVGFPVDLAAGWTIELATSGPATLDTVVYLFGPGATPGTYAATSLAVDDDSGDGLLSHLAAFEAPSDGRYLAVVTTFEGKGVGQAGFEVRVNGAPGCSGACVDCSPEAGDVAETVDATQGCLVPVPDCLDFGAFGTGVVSVRPLSLRNDCDHPVTVTSLGIEGDLFETVEVSVSPEIHPAEPAVVQPGALLTVQVSITMNLIDAGVPVDAFLAVRSDDPTQPSWSFSFLCPGSLEAGFFGGEICSPDGWCWSRVPVGSPQSAVHGTASDDVWVVGQHILHFDGSRWSVLWHAAEATWKPSATSQGYLQAVHAVTKTDAWAAGRDGTVMHWNGTIWTASDAGVDCTLVHLWASGPDDAWTACADASLLHWNGTAWAKAPGFDAKADVTALFGTDANDVWVATAGANATLHHWNGTSWSNFATEVPRVNAFWGREAGNLWAGGGDGTSSSGWGRMAALLHWDGTKWVRRASPGRNPILSGWPDTFGGFLMGDSSGTGLMNAGPDGWYDGRENATNGPVWGTDSNDLWAEAGRLHKGAAGWTFPTPGLFGGQSGLAFGVSFGPDDAWFARSQGVGADSLVHWDGRGLAPSGPGAAALLDSDPRALWGSSASDVWLATGTAVRFGRMFHWNGSWWDDAGCVPRDPRALWGSASDDAWAVGGDGLVLRCDGTAWRSLTPVENDDCEDFPGPRKTDIAPPASEDVEFVSISGSGPDDVWIAGNDGDSGVLLNWNGSQWSTPGIALPPLSAVKSFGPGDAWIAYTTGSRTAAVETFVRHFDGKAWGAAESLGHVEFASMDGTCSEDLWVAGSITSQALDLSSTLWHRTADGWQKSRSWSTGRPTAVIATAPGEAWLLDQGALLRHGKACAIDGDCAVGNTCVAARCQDGRCHEEPISSCCQVNAHCNDNDPCTADVCMYGECMHWTDTTVCCTDGDFCQKWFEDGDSYTEEICTYVANEFPVRSCIHWRTDQHPQEVGWVEDFEEWDDPERSRRAGWTMGRGGSSMFNRWGRMGDGTLEGTALAFTGGDIADDFEEIDYIAASPRIRMDAELPSSGGALLQWKMRYRHGGGPDVQLTVGVGSADHGQWLIPSFTAWTGEVSEDMPFGQYTAALPAGMFDGSDVRVTFSLYSEADQPLWWLIDDVAIVPGHPLEMLGTRAWTCGGAGPCSAENGTLAMETEGDPEPLAMGVCDRASLVLCARDPDATPELWASRGAPEIGRAHV